MNKATYSSSHLHCVDCVHTDIVSNHCVLEIHSSSFKLFLKEILLGDCKHAHFTEEQFELANSLCDSPQVEMG